MAGSALSSAIRRTGNPIDGGTVVTMTRARNVSALTGVGFFADQASQLTPRPPADPLSRQVAQAGSAAVDHARRRLASRLPPGALQAADQYFASPDVNPWEGATRPEPGADVLLLSPGRRSAAATAKSSIELRQFDRQCPGWAPFADDVAAVTGADVVLRLLVADGGRKARGWRRAASDVLVTVIAGAEEFAVTSTEPPDAEPVPELETVLRAGDTLRLPRTMLHTARPDAGGCAVLSMKLRRVTDWSLRRCAPSHLGFRDYPPSVTVYRLCLRSHVPPTPSAGWDPDEAVLRTRIPGGLAVLGLRGAEVTFVAAGSVYRAGKPVLRVLAGVHAADGIRMPDVSEITGVPPKTARAAVEGLLSWGLIRADLPPP
jgi:hypothetical protein